MLALTAPAQRNSKIPNTYITNAICADKRRNQRQGDGEAQGIWPNTGEYGQHRRRSAALPYQVVKFQQKEN